MHSGKIDSYTESCDLLIGVPFFSSNGQSQDRQNGDLSVFVAPQ